MKIVEKYRAASRRKTAGDSAEQNEENITVRLGPVFGMQPRIYVPAVWLIIAAAAVFFPLVLPGLRRSGTELTIYTDPPNASIIVDGVRAGRSGRAVFVKKGRRTLTLRRPGFEELVSTMDIKGRIFASRLLPRRLEVDFRLTPKDNYSPWPAAVDDFASWTATGPQRGRYALPPTLTAAARDTAGALNAAGANTPADSDAKSADISADDLLSDVLPMSRDNRHLADALRAAWIIENPDAALSPWNLLSFVDGLAASAGSDSRAGSRGNAAAGVLAAIADASGEGSSTFERLFNRNGPAYDALEPPFDRPREIYDELSRSGDFQPQIIGGLTFLRIPDLTAPIGDMEVAAAGDYKPRFGAVPVMVRIESFRIGMREVSNDEFARFTAENPQWLPVNRNALAASGLADEAYLESWSLKGPPEGSGAKPAVHVSWYAAEAYARWFAERFLSAGETARLPREDEWEVAARINAVVPNTAELPAGIKDTAAADSGAVGIQGMAGSVREWCWNPFRYNENLYRGAGAAYQRPDHPREYFAKHIHRPDSAGAAYQRPDHPRASSFRPIRGGSYIDGGLLFPAAARGALRAERTSPVLGFRIVIVPDDSPR